MFLLAKFFSKTFFFPISIWLVTVQLCTANFTGLCAFQLFFSNLNKLKFLDGFSYKSSVSYLKAVLFSISSVIYREKGRTILVAVL